MSIDIEALAKRCDALSRREVRRVDRTDWQGDRKAMRRSKDLAQRAGRGCQVNLNLARQEIASGGASAIIGRLRLAIVDHLTATPAHDRISLPRFNAQFRATLLESAYDRLGDYAALPSEVLDAAATDVEATLAQFADLDHTSSSGAAVVSYWTAGGFDDVMKAQPHDIPPEKIAATSVANAIKGIEKIMKRTTRGKALLARIPKLPTMMKFLGIAQTSIIAVGATMRAIADGSRWGDELARQLTRVTVSVGAMMVTPAIAAAIEAQIVSLGGIIGATIEAPPVAVALLAAGLVLVVSELIVLSLDLLWDYLFHSRTWPTTALSADLTMSLTMDLTMDLAD